jgi:hypothetical protein
MRANRYGAGKLKQLPEDEEDQDAGTGTLWRHGVS